MIITKTIHITTAGREIICLSDDINHIIPKNQSCGLANVFLHHTSASLILCENADKAVLRDLENFMSRLVKDGDPRYEHTAEGDDDMPAHIRSVLTQSSISIPIANGELALGMWQGIYLWEHRYHPHKRRITVSIVG